MNSFLKLTTFALFCALPFQSIFAALKTFEPYDSITIFNYTAPYIPDSLFFCEQQVPLFQSNVKECLDRELIQNNYYHSNIILNLKRANRFFPIIDSILAANHIPLDLKYLCIAESNLTQAFSPARAAGFWQFMEATGRSYGLEIRNGIDERYHIEKATEAACKFLRCLYNQFNHDWFLAAAAYNMGAAGLQRNLKRQKVDNYWDLWLNSETARYVYRILSYKLIMEDPVRYHFKLNKDDLYPQWSYEEVKVDSDIVSLYQFAQDHHVSYRALKELNYWLRDTSLTVQGKTYLIKIPTNSPAEEIISNTSFNGYKSAY